MFNVQAIEAIPFTCSFDNESDLESWNIYNRDEDENSWFYGKADMGGYGAQSKASSNYGATDNWLVSPAIHFEENGRYELSMMVYSAYYCTEKMQVTIGTQPEPESQTTILKDITVPYGDGYYGYKVSILLTDIEEGDYHVGIRYYTEATNTMLVTVKNFSISTITNGNLSGIVRSSNEEPLQGVKIAIAGTVNMETTSDENGNYSFTDIPQGEYTLSAELFGYNKITNQKVTVTPEITSTSDITMYEMTQVAFSGVVKDANGSPIPGASVRIDGYAKYRTHTDAEGKFLFEKVYIDSYSTQYAVEVRKNNFIAQTTSAYLSSYYENTKDFTLAYAGLAPFSVAAKQTSDVTAADVQWSRPIDLTELKYDNGEPSEPLGFSNGRDDANILGSIFREPMTIHQVKWFTMEYTGKCPYVNIFILGLDENGEPTGETLFTKEQVPTIDGTWSSYTLEEPLFCPNGFMIALSGNGNISLAKDSNPDIVGGKTQLYSNFIAATDAYKYFEDVEWEGALMLRAVGEAYQIPEFTPAINYDVFRFLEQDKEDASKWQKIAEAQTGTEYTDNAFETLPRGTYYYAVKANYPVGNLVSEATVSNPVYKLQHAAVTIHVTTNSVDEDAIGAVVKLDDPEGFSYTAVVGNDNNATFNEVWKSNYTLSVSQPGFTHEAQNVDFSEQESYNQDALLQQILAPVNNIDIVETEKSTEKMLLWDLFADIEDDFESEEAYSDFEINPSGTIGWQYVDNDGFATYSFSGSTFPGMGSAMAAIIMNGNATEPPVTTDISHSGVRELAFIACRAAGGGEGGLVIRPSDDYLISPRLSFHKDFQFRFFARTYQNQEGRLESFRIGYSTTDAALESFTYVTDGYVSVPEKFEYTEYEYTIPKEAKYVTLNSRSDDVFMLLVDDIKIGTGIKHSGEQQSYGNFTGYKVYLDGQLMGEQTENQCLIDISALTEGEHTASVSKVYRSGESESLSITFSTNEGSVEGMAAEKMKIYAANRKLHIKGDYKEAAVYNVAGSQIKAWEAPAEVMDLSAIPQGIYIVKVTTLSGKSVTAKISIE